MSKFLNFILGLSLLSFSIFAGLVLHNSTGFVTRDNHFSLLAQSFLKNDLFLDPQKLPSGDYADYMGKQYLYFGLAPSIILLPFVYTFGDNFNQFFLSVFSLILIFISSFLIARRFINKVDSLLLACFFNFGTVIYFVGIVFISSFLAQVLATAFLMLALLEFYTKRRWLIIGILVALGGLTRFTLYGSLFFFAAWILLRRNKIQKNLLLLIIPVVVSMIFFGAYNLRRFHSVFDSGYSHQTGLGLYPMSANVTRGFLSLSHLSANSYLLLLKSPEPIVDEGGGFVLKFPYIKADGWGLAIWFTSPLFLYLIRLKVTKITILSLITVFILLAPSLFYFGLGFVQFGYRYSTDFLPFLFLCLLPIFKGGLPKFAKFLITIGILFNGFYMLSIWDKYPLFELLGFK